MGKNLIIKGADFSENSIIETYVPNCVRLGQVGSDLTKARDYEYWTLTDATNELSGKTIIGFDLQFTNTLPNNATKSCKLIFGEEEVLVSCDFVEGDTSKTKRVMLQNPFTFTPNGSIQYQVVGNVTSQDRGGCDVYRKTRVESSVPEYAFSIQLTGQQPLQSTDFMPFKKLLLA